MGKGQIRNLGGLLGAAAILLGAAGAEPQPRPREFWEKIVAADYAVPEGESAAALLEELSGLLGSPDPQERDGFGYGIPARWIYRDRLLSADELRRLLRRWSANLKVDVGQVGEATLLRSFSALDLSILAAHDNREPFLSRDEFRALLEDALAYLAAERDVRGYVEGIGWVHSAAHTADLLKFLGRSRHLDREGQRHILDGIAAKMEAPDGGVYTWGEDERLARAVLSILHREDLDAAAFRGWLESMAGRADGLWEGKFDPARFAAAQNAKNLLRGLHVLLSTEEEPGEALRAARRATLEALGRM